MLTREQIGKNGKVFSHGNSFYRGPIPADNPVTKRGHLSPIAALKGASNLLALPITATSAVAHPEAEAEHYIIQGTTGAHQDPKASLVYFMKADNTLALAWRVETDLLDDWILTYVDAATATTVHGVVNWVADASYQV